MTSRERVGEWIWAEPLPDYAVYWTNNSTLRVDTVVMIKLSGYETLSAYQGTKEDAESMCDELRGMFEAHVLEAMKEARREAAEKIGDASYEKLLEAVVKLRDMIVPYERTCGNVSETRWNRMIQDIDEALIGVGMDPKEFDIGVDIEGERV